MKRFTQTLIFLFISFLLLSFSALACDECVEKEPKSSSRETHTWEDSLKVSDEVLSLPTEELLEYFLNSDFLIMDVVGRSGPMTEETDYTVYPVYSELIKRTDFVRAIEKKAQSLVKKDSATLEKALFMSFLSQKNTAKSLEQYPETKSYIQKAFYGQDTVKTKGAGTPVYTQSGIDYYYGGSVYSTSGNAATVLTADREWILDEKTKIDNIYKNYGTKLLSATTKFNCHSYAWYRAKTWNPYYIIDYSPFVADSSCQSVSSSSVKVNDIVVYKKNGLIAHSAVVYQKSGNQLTLKSKFGQAGLYTHSLYSVPYNYDTISYYRYHDYVSEYTGNHYHKGRYHYYKKKYVCRVCGDSYGSHYEKVICSGPPCVLPFAIVGDEVDR